MPSTITDRLIGLTTSVAVKAPVRLATTGPIALYGHQTIDGFLTSTRDRVLVKDQPDATENGIWNATSAAWVRASDFNGSLDAVGGTMVHVAEGGDAGDTFWSVDGNGPIDIGSDEIGFSLANSAALEANLESVAGGTLVGFSQAGTGAVATNARDKMRQAISVFDFIPVSLHAAIRAGTNLTPLHTYIRHAIAEAADKKRFLDMCGGPLLIAEDLDFTALPGVVCNFQSPIVVDVEGTFANDYAVTFGDPSTGDGFTGRWIAGCIVGHLYLIGTRDAPLNGFYLKGHRLTIGSVTADFFDGEGLHLDNVWDSIIGRLSSEETGNEDTWSINLDATLVDGENNTTNITSLQSEQAYHRGIYANLLRYRIQNVHAERLAVLTVNDGTAEIGYLNHHFIIGNGSLDQAVFDCLPSGTAPDGSALAATTMNIRLTGDNCAYTEIHAPQSNIFVDYGTGVYGRNLLCLNFYQKAPSTGVVVDVLKVSGETKLALGTIINSLSTNDFDVFQNAAGIEINGGGVINDLDFSNTIYGDITFNYLLLADIRDVKAPQQAERMPVTFNACRSDTIVGANGAEFIVNGGKSVAVALASQAIADIQNHRTGNFGSTGNTAYLTHNVRATGTIAWTTPANLNYPAGTTTERVGYNAAGKIYQNTDGAVNWAAI